MGYPKQGKGRLALIKEEGLNTILVLIFKYQNPIVNKKIEIRFIIKRSVFMNP